MVHSNRSGFAETRIRFAEARTGIRIVRAAHELLVPGEGGGAPQVTLKGVKAAQIAALGAEVAKYKSMDITQGEAAGSVTNLLNAFRAEVQNTLNPLRRDLQLAADQAWPHHVQPYPAEIRRAFHIPVDRALI